MGWSKGAKTTSDVVLKMPEILGLGISHYPSLSGRDETMAGILKSMMSNPTVPEAMKTPARWPEGMRAEWESDNGKAAATRHRKELVAWNRRAHEALDDFKPDFVLIWGDDQYENFREAACGSIMRVKSTQQQLGTTLLDYRTEASIAKALGGKAARQIAQGGVELLGAEGLSEDYLAEKWFRDSRIADIYEGAGEIQRILVARAVLGYKKGELSKFSFGPDSIEPPD
jgi:Acyl-CoA dehydrogenase, C-terminal domain